MTEKQAQKAAQLRKAIKSSLVQRALRMEITLPVAPWDRRDDEN